ncbi:mitochondrial proton/calcium exchanger protein isoform X2 [Eurosta solidaginis]
MNMFIRHQPKILRSAQTSARITKDGSSRKYYTPQYLPRYALRQHTDGAGNSNYWMGGNCAGAQIGVQPILLSRWSNISETHYHTQNWQATRKFHLTRRLGENASSKVEVTVKTMKEKQKEKVEEIIKEAASTPTVTTTKREAAEPSKADAAEPQKAVVAKKSLGTRIWEELVHYYHGFRLLVIDINISRKLLWRVLNGKTLTRRENKLLLRTTSDLFRLIPFSVFLIVPFMELLLPFFIRFFPGMLPSTFQTSKDRENKLKQSLQVRLEMAKFLQQTLDEMAVQHKDHRSEEAKQFAEFFEKIKDPQMHVPVEEIIKFAKRFEDEITLDSLSREQLAALCRVLELNTMGTSNLLRFQLRLKLRSLAADDRVIAREGVEALDLFELQQACKARGMRAYGLTSEKLRAQLQEWIDLSLNEKVPPSLLLLSRALLISDDTATTHKLVETMRVLPEAVATKTKEKIGESEGKIDNKTKIEVLKEEERKIREEREEEREAEKAKLEEEHAKAAEELLHNTPFIQSSANVISNAERLQAEASNNITSKDVELLSDALKSLSTDKKMMVEKETLKDLKEELEDYKEDLEELREVRSVVKEPVHESRAAKMLFKKVNSMIGQLDKVLVDMEKKRETHQQKSAAKTDAVATEKAAAAESLPTQDMVPDIVQDIVHITELMNIIKKLQKTSDETRLKQIEKVLSKIDADKDGMITVDEVLKVVEAISRENVNLSDKQIEELVTLLDKENVIETEERLEKAIAKSIKMAEKQIKDQQKQADDLKAAEELKDIAPELKDNAKDLSLDAQKNIIKTESSNEKNPLLEAAEKQTEKILPKADISAQIPQQPIPSPPPPTTATQLKAAATANKDMKTKP